ncbi:MAG: DinB family protein [Chitinophagaceae bacterium]|nr:DinB family protein [Chitinophagaceae bacterium]
MKYFPQDGFPYYLQLAKTGDLQSVFGPSETLRFFNSIPEEKSNYRYAPEKWSIKQVVGHITDHERIKMQRAFLLSRKQPVELWGYDQESLVRNSRFDELPFHQLIKDLENVRNASISFIDSLSESQLKITGSARQYEVTLEDFLRTIIGHEIHHINIIKEKYI